MNSVCNCTESWVAVIVDGGSAHNVTRSVGATLSAVVSTCVQFFSYGWTFVSDPANIPCQAHSLEVAAGAGLALGSYHLQFNASISNMTVWSDVFVLVVRSELVVLVSGSMSRSVNVQSVVSLDASGNHDLDGGVVTLSWSCMGAVGVCRG